MNYGSAVVCHIPFFVRQISWEDGIIVCSCLWNILDNLDVSKYDCNDNKHPLGWLMSWMLEVICKVSFVFYQIKEKNQKFKKKCRNSENKFQTNFRDRVLKHAFFSVLRRPEQNKIVVRKKVNSAPSKSMGIPWPFWGNRIKELNVKRFDIGNAQ